MIIQLVKAAELVFNVTKHGTKCDPFLLFYLFYLGSLHVTYFIFMQFKCNKHTGAELTVTDTSVTSVLHQSVFLNFLLGKKLSMLYGDV